MYDAVNCKVFAKAAASFTMDCWRAPAARRALAWAGAQGVSYLHFTKQSVLEENSGHAAILTDTGGLHLTNRCLPPLHLRALALRCVMRLGQLTTLCSCRHHVACVHSLTVRPSAPHEPSG